MASENLEIEVIVNGKKAVASLKDVETSTKKIGKQTEKTDDQISKSAANIGMSWKKVGAAIVAVGATAKAIDIGKDIFETTLRFEKLGAMLKVATGSAEAADVQFDKIKEFAKTTPYDLEQVTTAFIKLKNLGLNPSMETLKSYGNTASAMGKSLDQFIEAVADASVGEFERLKEFGIKASSEGDKVRFTFRGVTEEIKKSSDDIQSYLRNIGDENFGTAMSEQMDTLGGKVSNLSDTWEVAFNNIGSSKSGLIGSVIEGLTDLGAALGEVFDDSISAQIKGVEESLGSMTSRMTKLQDELLNRQTSGIDFLGISFDTDEVEGQIEGLKGLIKATEDELEQLRTQQWEEQSQVEMQQQDELETQKAEKKKSRAIELAKELQKIQLESEYETYNMLKAWDEQNYQEQLDRAKANNDYEWGIAEAAWNREVEGIEEAEKAKQKAIKETQKNAEEVADRISTAIFDMALDGKLSFADMARAMVADLIRVQMQAFITQAITALIPGGSFLSGLFHTGGEVKHTGGTIGGNLPTYHSGMRSDERAAKLQVGEAVINRAGARNNAEAIEAMNAGYKVGGGGGNVTTAEINFNVQAIDSASFNNYLVNNRSTIEGIINRSIQTNGTVRKTIKQVG